jgi:flagellar M-ring protein FliF
MNFFQRLLANISNFFNRMGPLQRFLLLSGGVLVLIIFFGLLYLSSGTGEYRTAFTNLPLDEVNAMTTKLSSENIPYKLSDSGTTILVPTEQIAKARVTLAAEGLPLRGGKGYELFDTTGLGTPPKTLEINLTRALQTELARLLMSMDPIASARVIITRPEPTPFVRTRNEASASVVLKLKSGNGLNRSTASAIVSLVSRSIEGLKPENVTIVDSNGRLLSDPNIGSEDAAITGRESEYRTQYEADLARKAEEVLTRHLGPGRAIIRVTADIDFQKLKEISTTYSPDAKVIGRETTKSSKSTSTGGAKGPAGAVSNINRPAAGGGGGGSNTTEETIETEYKVSEVQRQLEARPAVRRISVAALVDLSQSDSESGTPKTIISLTDAQELIKTAVGFRSPRDEIKVSDVPLPTLLAAPLPEEDPETARIARLSSYVSLVRNIVLAVAVVFTLAILALVLMRVRRRPEAPTTQPIPTGGTAAEREQQNLNQLIELAQRDPDQLVNILTNLLAEPAQ